MNVPSQPHESGIVTVLGVGAAHARRSGAHRASTAALFLFGLTPAPLNFVWLFCNGLLLGMVFGLVLGFLEGRRQTEAVAAGLCISFVVADGVTKSAGRFW
jgi:hypothetical protein